MGGFTFLPDAVTASGAVPAAESREAVRSRSCPAVHRAVKFYAGRIAYWRSKMGAAPSGRSRLGNCPRYLAHVLQRKAYALRREYARQVALVVSRLEAGIRVGERMHGVVSPMRGTGAVLERIARASGVSPYFVLAVAMTESSLGAAACSSNRMNAWGLSSCGAGWYVPHFSSWAEAYAFFAAFVNRQFPGHSSPWSFRGYAACSDCWARKVSEWMGRLFGVAAVTRYP